MRQAGVGKAGLGFEKKAGIAPGLSFSQRQRINCRSAARDESPVGDVRDMDPDPSAPDLHRRLCREFDAEGFAILGHPTCFNSAGARAEGTQRRGRHGYVDGLDFRRATKEGSARSDYRPASHAIEQAKERPGSLPASGLPRYFWLSRRCAMRDESAETFR